MELIAAFGGGLFVLASLIVGGRLMWLSTQTRGLPEFLLGSGLFFMGGVGYPLMITAIKAEGLSDTARITMLGLQMCTSVAGMCGVTWFTRRVFRPNAAWAGVLLVAIGASYVGLVLAQVLGAGMMAFLAAPDSGAWSMTAFLGVVPMSWAGYESVRYYNMQRKRLVLGLADPVVTDRFRLWGVSILAADSITIASAVFKLVGIPIAATPIGAMLVGSLGLVTAGGLWLAFVPPRFYLDRVAARVAGTTNTVGA